MSTSASSVSLLFHPATVISAIKNTIGALKNNDAGAATAALGDTLSVLNSFVSLIKTIPYAGPAVAALGLQGNIDMAKAQLDKDGYIKPETICNLAPLKC